MNIYILNRVGLLWKQNSVINLVFHFFFTCKSTSRNENEKNVGESFKSTEARI